jgi:hypothetical protein
MKGRALAASLLLACTAPVTAGERVSIKVSPAVAFAPANLFVRATVEVSRDNRSIEIIAESEDYYRSSEVALDGDRAPRTTLFQFKSLPGGEYEVRAVLKGNEGREIASTQAHLNIVGEGGR